jgi:hypothetical protein
VCYFFSSPTRLTWPPGTGSEAASEISAVTELTFHSNVVAMLGRWKEVNPGKAVFFVLDQIELFAKTKQNLLYSLLNLMQEKEPPVAIIGLAGALVRSVLPSLLIDIIASIF